MSSHVGKCLASGIFFFSIPGLRMGGLVFKYQFRAGKSEGFVVLLGCSKKIMKWLS